MGGAVSSGRDNNELIDNLMSGNYIRTKEVERVFRALDRAEYMTPEARDQAYKDLAWRNGPLHLSSPCIYSEVMEGLELKPGLSFLNVGSGTGYFSTLVGLILGTSGISHGVEVHPAVVEYATKKISLFYENSPILDDFDFCEPKFYHGNGLCLNQLLSGYDRVYCGAGCPEEYENYFKRLIKVGGILVMPLNDRLLQVRRVGEDKWTSRSLLNVSFATLRVPTTEEAANKVKLDKQTPVRLMYLARAAIRESMRGGVTRRHPELREAPRAPPPAACPRRICIPLETGGEVEGLNVLHDLDSENGANEMNALLSLVISMGQSRVAGALRFDRLTPSDSEDEDQDNPDHDNDNQNNDNQENDQDNRNQDNEHPDNYSDDNDRPDNHDQDNNHLDNHNQDNGHPDNQKHNNNNRDHRNPVEERLPNNEDPSSRRLGENELPSRNELRPGGMVTEVLFRDYLDLEDEDYLRKTFDNTLRHYNSTGAPRPGDRSNNTEGSRSCRTNDTDSRPGDENNTASTSTSGNNINKTVGNDAGPSEPGNKDDNRRPRANSTDDNKSNSRKSGRTRSLYGKSRDPLLMSYYENDSKPSTSCDKYKSGPDTKNAADSKGENTDKVTSQDSSSVTTRPDLPCMPSEVEIDLGKMAQKTGSATDEMAWEETRPDTLEGSEDDTDTSNSKPKRQKLDSGIGETTPSASSPEKSKSENSDSDCHLQYEVGPEDFEESIDDSASDEDRLGSSDTESEIESDSSTDDTEGFHEGSGGSRSPSHWSASPPSPGGARGRRSPAGGDARRVRLSCLMKQAVDELPLPHALKTFVNLGRCFEF